ncbi:hypothetical protein DFH08DRAFT_865497 [Mycena albidolilacea]|uniref:SnoaL-like domain-containing protein n=1 Tax=Mycena albidolilacea TaxID=1033008 RepID=A0AAD7EUP2_9AGAR|nr:hypothetical protein DFH08DRAFT_865497 [Mycena albidolilacea]
MSNHHHRSPSASSRASNEPSQTHHHSILPTIVPTPALVESVAGGAHYSGSNVEQPLKHRNSSHDRPSSHTDLKADHERVLTDIRSLYELHPDPEIFKRSWHPDAVFEDPLAKAKGFREYAAQWYAMPILFAKSETVDTRVMSSTTAPNRIVFSQTQRYKNRFMDKTISSVVTVDLDDSDRIIRLVEQWDGKALPSRFGGGLLRRLNAKVTSLLVRVPR